LNNQRNWWHGIWQAIPERLKLEVTSTDLFNPEFLRNIQNHFDSWQKKLTFAEAYLNRYQHIVKDWIARLRNPSDQDRNELSKIYLQNANVIGITCVQAARHTFRQKYNKFDVVIIDEVSKSTPPELLIPSIKGKKVVMIGDYRQLPPMLDEKTLKDIAEEISMSEENLEFLDQSWFKLQFEAANTAQKHITRKLNTQYRMHPQIMEAINQFYNEGDGGLVCGLSDPDKQRSHNLTGSVIREDNHILWVKMPQGRIFEERKQGTSYSNEEEINVIERLCEQMNESWSARVAEGEKKKEIGIITFYGAQLRLIKNRIESNNLPFINIRTGTVDIFQGMERPVIIVSMVRNNRQGIVGFARTPERVNVAFSRAKELLVIVGCHDLFTTVPIYQEVSNIVRRHRGFVDVSRFI
jgi:superfamily I DNA and/or RNA helicase